MGQSQNTVPGFPALPSPAEVIQGCDPMEARRLGVEASTFPQRQRIIQSQISSQESGYQGLLLTLLKAN